MDRRPGRAGRARTGEVLFASSLTLTNEYLYYLVGNGTRASWAHASWKDHYVYRYAILGGASAGAAPRAPTTRRTARVERTAPRQPDADAVPDVDRPSFSCSAGSPTT